MDSLSPRRNLGWFDRERFVRRAEVLQQPRRRSPFRQELDEVRHEWDERFPQYRLGEQGAFDSDEVRLHGGRVYPPALLSDWEALRREDDLRYGPRSSDDGTGEVNPLEIAYWWERRRENQAAGIWWHSKIEQLAISFWPPEDFPHPRMTIRHPAENFVALCLIHPVDDVPSDSIDRFELGPRWAPVDPEDIDHHPIVVQLRAQLAAMEQAVHSVALHPDLGRHEGERRDWAKREVGRALSVGSRVPGASPQLLSPSSERGFLFVAIPPGLTVAKWQAVATEAVVASGRRFGDDPLVARISHYEQQGLKAQQIADLLGYPKDTIRSALHRVPTNAKGGETAPSFHSPTDDTGVK